MNVRSRDHFKRKLLFVAVASCFGFASTAGANGSNPVVVGGSASFVTSGKTLTITNSPNAIINWKNFSIGRGETTIFNQLSSSSSVFNRVTGGDPSRILGTLQSNGKVFLVNPNGVFFGKGAVVDVAGLVASSLNMSDADFLAGKMRFNADRAVPGAVSNAGSIATPAGGFVYLIAPKVKNSGVITTPGGEAILAAGNFVELVDSTDPALRVVVSANSQDVNLSQMMTQNAGNVFSVLNSGKVTANTAVVGENGKIYFQSAGNIRTTATSVVETKGNASLDGGRIRSFADRDAVYAGSFDASGKNGGFIETSGSTVDVSQAALNLRALSLSGLGGEWLLDPGVINVDSILAASVVSQLEAGTHVILDTATGTSGTEDININSAINPSLGTGSYWLTLNAGRDINVNSAIQSSGMPMQVDFNSGRDTNIGAFVVTNNGAMNINAGGKVTVNAAGKLSTGNILDNLTSAGILSVVSDADSVLNGGADTSTDGGILMNGKMLAGAILDVKTFSKGIQIGGNQTSDAKVQANTINMHAYGTSAGAKGDVLLKGATTINLKTLVTGVDVNITNDGGQVKLQAQNAPGASVQVFSSASQTVVSASDVIIQGGSGNGADASLYLGSSGTSQNITTGGKLSVNGGALSTGGSWGFVQNDGASQKIVATSVEVKAGGILTGNQSGNKAFVRSAGAQTIEATGVGGVQVQGGSTKGGSNQAVISADGPQVIYSAGDVAVTGGGGTGTGNDAEIYSMAQQKIYFTTSGSRLKVEGGNAAGSTNSAQMRGVTGQLIAGLNCNGGCGGTDDTLNQINDAEIILKGGAGASGFVTLAAGDSSGAIPAGNNAIQEIHAAKVSVTAGGGDNAFASILNTGTLDSRQLLYVGSGGITLKGGDSGIGSRAGIFLASTTSSGLQHIETGGNIDLTGGNSSDNDAHASISVGTSSASPSADQEIYFTNPGLLLKLTAGASGENNYAGLDTSGTHQTIQGWNGSGYDAINNPDIIMRGGGVSTSLNDDASISMSSVAGAGTQTINAIGINMAGGAGVDSGTGIGMDHSASGSRQLISLSGDLVMDAGSGESNVGAGIGAGKVDTDITITAASLTMKGGANARALIGAVGCAGNENCTAGPGNDTKVSITVANGIGLDSSARAGSVGIGSQFGHADVTLAANGGNVNLGSAAVGSQQGVLSSLDSVKITAKCTTAYGGGISQNYDGGVRTWKLDAQADNGGVSLLGENVVSNQLIAKSNGTLGDYENVVVNLLANDSVGGGAAIPSLVTLQTAATGSDVQLGFVDKVSAGDIVASSSWNLIGDHVSIFANGSNLTVNGAGLAASSALLLQAGSKVVGKKNLTINSSISTPGNITLAATDSVNVNGSLFAGFNSTLKVVASNGNVNMTNGTAEAKTIDILAFGDFTADNYNFNPAAFPSRFDLHTATGNATFTNGSSVFSDTVDLTIGNNLYVNNFSSINGDPDVNDLRILGGKIYLDNGGQVVSGAVLSIYLEFPNLDSGGYVVDGVEGAITGSSGAGFYVNGGGDPAVLGTNLHVSYRVPESPLTEKIGEPNEIVDEINSANEFVFESEGINEGVGSDENGNEDVRRKKVRQCG